jgi:signal transduction histidine kinase
VTESRSDDRLAVLVHEIRSPIAALCAIAKALVDGTADPSSRSELVRLAMSACLAIERIVLDASCESVELRDVDPARVVQDVAAHASLEGAVVETSIASSLPPVSGDELRLRQALGNLVTNARVHSGSKAPIVVGARCDQGEVLLFVSDSGAGLADGDRQRILEPGVRLDPSRPGSGLGLAIVKAIAEAHGGHIRVASTVGVGSTFVIALPSG